MRQFLPNFVAKTVAFRRDFLYPSPGQIVTFSGMDPFHQLLALATILNLLNAIREAERIENFLRLFEL